MSTLTGNKISLTYKSLIKLSDNDVLTATLQQLSDGLGNNSGVYLNTGGDLKSTGTLEFANFKGTSTSVTINKLVNQADGISSNDNDTSLPTSAAVKDYVDTHVTSQDLDFSDGTTQSAIDLDSQVFSIVGTTNEIDTVASGQQLQIGLPNSITISGTYTGATFSGDLNGTINTATTAVTQSAGNNSTKVATTAYVDTLDAASDLDFSGTSGTGDVNLNTQTFAITGGANQITTAASNQGLVISLLSTGVTLPNNSIATTQSAGDNSTKVATTAYVDVLDAASDLDIAGDSGTGDVNLNTQTFTLSGTTNQVTTAVSGQTATFSLPSTVHRNLQGNVTGDLTGNADTATKWQTARDLSLTSEATGTISSVDGSGNVSGAVTLLNSAVTGKVLTGLPTPAAGNIQASDSILEAFGKLQSQVSSISNGLIFKGSWDADTNTPTLTSGGGEVDSGTTTGQATNKLIQTGQNFNTTVTVGDKVINQVDGTTALVTVIDSNTQLSLDADIMLSGEAYTIDASPFIQQGNYYVVNYAGTTNLNGNNSWSIGDWVIADADNRWSKLDHSQVDGQGTIGNLPVFATATTIGDSIVAQSGTALTVTGSLNTTLGASVTGDFAVNTNKFTVAAASGNTNIAGTTIINDTLYLTEYIQHLGNTSNNIRFTTDAIAISANATFAGDISLANLKSIYLGTSSALRIYTDSAVGFIKGNDVRLVNASGDNIFRVNGDVAELYHNDSKKFETTSTGVTVTGGISLSGNISASSGDLALLSSSGEYILYGATNGQTNLYHNGVKKFETTSGGVEVQGNVISNAIVQANGFRTTTGSTDYSLLTRNSSNTAVYIQQAGSGDILDVRYGSQAAGQGTSAFVVNSSGNATFAGDVAIQSTIPKLSFTDLQQDDWDIINDNGEFKFLCSTGSGVALQLNTNNTSAFGGNISTLGSVLFNDNQGINFGNSNAKINGSSSDGIKFFGSGSEKMRLNQAGNLGIGVSSLQSWAKLQVAGTAGAQTGANQALYVTAPSTTAGEGVGIRLSAASGSNEAVGIIGMVNNASGNAGSMTFHTYNGGADIPERMRITSEGITEFKNTNSTAVKQKSVIRLSGGGAANGYTLINDLYTATESQLNIGLGYSGSPVVISQNCKVSATQGHTYLSSNAQGNTRPQAFLLDAGDFVFKNTQTSSTRAIDSVVTLDERMRITSGGEVGIGSTDPRNKLTVKTAGSSAIEVGLRLVNPIGFTSAGSGVKIAFAQDRSDSENYEMAAIESKQSNGGSSSNGDLAFFTRESSALGERLRITAAGNVEITSGAIYKTNGITLIGNSDEFEFVDSLGSGQHRFRPKTDNSVDIGDSGRRFKNIYATNGTINTSDKNEKNTIKTSDLGLDFINKLKPVSYIWNDKTNTHYGLIAQEVEDVLKDNLKEAKDFGGLVVSDVSKEKDNSKLSYGLRYNEFIAPMIKAIQELKAEVDSLKKECNCK